MLSDQLASSGARDRSARIVPWLALAALVVSIGCDRASNPAAENATGVPRFGAPLSESASLQEVLAHPDVFERVSHVARILQASGPEDLEQLQETFEQAPLDAGDLEYALFMNWWGRFDPRAAFSYYNTQIRVDHPRVILEVVRMWGRQDPSAAVAAAELANLDKTRPAIRSELADTLVVGWFESGNPGLEDWILSQQTGEVRAAAYRAYTRMRILRDGADATLEWLRSSPHSEDDKRLIWAGALHQLARHQPETAVKWLAIAREDGIEVRSFTARIARSWAFHHPKAAMEWLRQQPEGDERSRATWDVAKRWMKHDPAELDEWIASLDEEEWTDGLRTFSLMSRPERERYQVDWAALMQEAKQLSTTVGEDGLQSWLLAHWLVVDRAGAEAWIQANPDELSEDYLGRSRASLTQADRKKIEDALATVRKSPS